jgi:PASTA domain
MPPAPEAPSRGKGVDFKHPGGKEALIAGGAALGLALLYFWWKNRQAANAQTAAGTAAGAASPTALLTAWFHDHAGSSPANTVTVPNVVGLNDTAADAALKAVGLTAEGGNEPKGGFGKATSIVTSQSPPAGTAVKPGSAVSLTFKVTQPKKPPPKKGGGDDSGES